MNELKLTSPTGEEYDITGRWTAARFLAAQIGWPAEEVHWRMEEYRQPEFEGWRVEYTYTHKRAARIPVELRRGSFKRRFENRQAAVFYLLRRTNCTENYLLTQLREWVPTLAGYEVHYPGREVESDTDGRRGLAVRLLSPKGEIHDFKSKMAAAEFLSKTLYYSLTQARQWLSAQRRNLAFGWQALYGDGQEPQPFCKLPKGGIAVVLNGAASIFPRRAEAVSYITAATGLSAAEVERNLLMRTGTIGNCSMRYAPQGATVITVSRGEEVYRFDKRGAAVKFVALCEGTTCEAIRYHFNRRHKNIKGWRIGYDDRGIASGVAESGAASGDTGAAADGGTAERGTEVYAASGDEGVGSGTGSDYPRGAGRGAGVPARGGNPASVRNRGSNKTKAIDKYGVDSPLLTLAFEETVH